MRVVWALGEGIVSGWAVLAMVLGRHKVSLVFSQVHYARSEGGEPLDRTLLLQVPQTTGLLRPPAQGTAMCPLGICPEKGHLILWEQWVPLAPRIWVTVNQGLSLAKPGKAIDWSGKRPRWELPSAVRSTPSRAFMIIFSKD